MKLISSILLSLGIALLFIGNIGVDVFKHFCDEDGVSVAYVINTIDHCDAHQEELPPCCEEEKEDDCCDDEVEFFQLKLDFFQGLTHFQFAVIPELEANSFTQTVLDLNEDLVSYYSNSDPPPIRQSVRLAKNQSYII